MYFQHRAAAAVTMTAMLGVVGTAQAAFQGRDATGAASGSCTATGAGKCTFFYDTTLNITILNNWSVGAGEWGGIGSGSVQARAASNGFVASGLDGWVLPTGDRGAAAGAQNQYLSIWNSVGSSFAGLSGQFDGVQNSFYWSATNYPPDVGTAQFFTASDGFQGVASQSVQLLTVAVRPGDIASAVPEPRSYALMLMGVGAVLLARRGLQGVAPNR